MVLASCKVNAVTQYPIFNAHYPMPHAFVVFVSVQTEWHGDGGPGGVTPILSYRALSYHPISWFSLQVPNRVDMMMMHR